MKKSVKAIICIAAAVLVCLIFNLIGRAKKYSSEYAAKLMWERQESQFPEISDAQAELDALGGEKAALSSDIDSLTERVDEINEYIKNKDTLEAELQELSGQAEELEAQKAEREQTLSDINNQISEY